MGCVADGGWTTGVVVTVVPGDATSCGAESVTIVKLCGRTTSGLLRAGCDGIGRGPTQPVKAKKVRNTAAAALLSGLIVAGGHVDRCCSSAIDTLFEYGASYRYSVSA